MKRYFLVLLLISFLFPSLIAQSSQLEDTLQQMLNQEEYEQITAWMEHVDADTLTAMSLYYTGVAFFVLEKDAKAVEYLKSSIKKDAYFGGSYYYLGLINEYNGQTEQAKHLYRSALEQSPGNTVYLEQLADLLNAQDLQDSAYTLYKRITNKDQPPARIFMKIAEIFVDQGADEKALETYYDCLYDAQSGSEFYNDCLYNIGYFEYQFGNYREASMVLETLYDRNPQDFAVAELLVQVYLKLEHFNKVNEFRSLLYEAHKDGRLPEDMRERFLLDVFESAGKEVLGYEYFNDPSEPGDIKYAFLVLDGEDTAKSELLLEYSTYALNQGEKYVITEQREGEKYLYPKALFSERINFEKLRETIDSILNGELHPASK